MEALEGKMTFSILKFCGMNLHTNSMYEHGDSIPLPLQKEVTV